MKFDYIDYEKEFPFSKRLEYFMNLLSVTPETLEEKSEDGSGIKIGARIIRKYLSGKTKPLEETKIRLSELLDIPSDYLMCDSGKFARAFSRTINNDQFDEDYFLNRNYLFGNYEFYDYKSYVESFIEVSNKAFEELVFGKDELDYKYFKNNGESNCNNDSILDKFDSMNLIDCYKLTKHFDVYIKIHEYAWQLMVNFSCLNTKGKETLKRFVSQMQTSIDLQLSNLNIITEFINLRNLCKDDENEWLNKEVIRFKGQNTDNQARTKLWEELSEKIFKQSFYDALRYYKQMDFITTMDFDDWNILIAFFLLTDTLTDTTLCRFSDKQEMLLIFSQELAKNKEYSDFAYDIAKTKQLIF